MCTENREVKHDSRLITVCRYSSTLDQKMLLRGLKGEMKLSGVPEELRIVFLAGEVLHIGKNTSFGFGRYCIL